MDWIFNFSLMFVGLFIVFVVLCLLIFLVWVFGKVMIAITARKEKKKKKAAEEIKSQVPPAPKTAPKAVPAVEQGITGDVVAAISAAVAMMSEGTNKQYRVRSIKRVKEGRSAWSMAGIAENTRPF